jgi:hypothetical protein
VTRKTSVFFNAMPCSLVQVYPRFTGPYYVHHQCEGAVESSKTSVNGAKKEGIATLISLHHRFSVRFSSRTVGHILMILNAYFVLLEVRGQSTFPLFDILQNAVTIWRAQIAGKESPWRKRNHSEVSVWDGNLSLRFMYLRKTGCKLGR